jgi:hypothetical protein
MYRKLTLAAAILIITLLSFPGLGRTAQDEAFTNSTLAYGVDTVPSFSGGFIQNKQASFRFEVKNTGNQGADRFNLVWKSENPGWSAAFFDANSRTPLKDTDGDGNPDTGLLEQGAVKAVLLMVARPPDAEVGENTRFTVTARSVKDPSRTAQTQVYVAVPTSFAQAYMDEEANIRLGLFSSHSFYNTKMEGWFQGTTLTVTALPDEYFIYSWEMTGKYKYWNGYKDIDVNYTDIEYTLIDRLGNVMSPTQKLIDNKNYTVETRDRFPHLSVDSNGNTGIAWIRTIQYDNAGQAIINSNVYMTVLNLKGEKTDISVNITKNQESINVTEFSTPRISAVDGKLVISWVKSIGTGEEKDIWYAIYNQQGQELAAPKMLSSRESGDTAYHSPNLISLPSGRVLAAYSIENLTTKTSTLAYTVINSSGQVLSPQRLISGSQGARVDGTYLESGNVLLAWTNGMSIGITYAIINATTYDLSKSPENLMAPDGRKSDFVSVTHDNLGNGVLTWLDYQHNNYLYYALVDGTGLLRTPPIPFYSTPTFETFVLTSNTGQGNTFYSGHWQIYLPTIIRR